MRVVVVDYLGLEKDMDKVVDELGKLEGVFPKKILVEGEAAVPGALNFVLQDYDLAVVFLKSRDAFSSAVLGEILRVEQESGKKVIVFVEEDEEDAVKIVQGVIRGSLKKEEKKSSIF